MVFCAPLAHVHSCLADNGRCGPNVDSVDSGQIGARHAKQFRTEIESRLVLFFLAEPLWAFLIGQWRAGTSVCSPLQILLQPFIALGYLPRTELVSVLLLLHQKQKILLPVAPQPPCIFSLPGFPPMAAKSGQQC